MTGVHTDRSGGNESLDESEEVPDRQVMEAVQDGDVEALRLLISRYWAPLVAYSVDFVKDRDTAQDVVQGVFIQVWKHRERWSPSSTVNAYLYAIARNLSLNARRDSSLREQRHDEGGRAELDWASVRRPDQELAMSVLEREVEAALEELSERRREVFVLSRFHGLTHREIADALGTSPQTVANQVSAALEQLRDALSHRLE